MALNDFLTAKKFLKLEKGSPFRSSKMFGGVLLQFFSDFITKTIAIIVEKLLLKNLAWRQNVP